MQLHLKPTKLMVSLFVATLLVASVSGCGKKDLTATQAVARVDGAEISVHQINQVLSRAQGITPENLPKAKLDILEGLIDQQLAINLATSKKLDRTPEVVMAIETAKREIIARAAMDSITSSLPKATDEEAKQYYAANPALFSERRIYSLQEIALPKKSSPDMAAVNAKVDAAKSMEEVLAWLNEKKIQFSANAGNRSAEQIPLEILPRLHKFKDGQMGVLESKDSFVIMRVSASRAQPVTLEQALPRIKVFLFNQRATDVVREERTQMKAKAKVEYLGEFAGGEAAYKEKIAAQAQAKEQANAQAADKAKADAEALAKQKAAEMAEAQAQADARSKARSEARTQASKDPVKAVTPTDANLEKGIKGLK